MKVPRFLISHRKEVLLTGVWLACLTFFHPTIAQTQSSLSNKPIKIIAPAAPGGILDLTSRLLGEKLSAQIGRPVIVENRPGNGGMLGVQAMLRAEPDGTTLVMGSLGPNAANYALHKTMLYEKKDLAPLIHVLSMPDVLVVNTNLPVKNMQELRTLSRTKPGGLSMAVSTSGSSGHLAGELIKIEADISAVNIIYKGAAPALIDLVGGQVDLMVDNLITAMPLIRQGKLRAIAVTSAERSPELPDIPTMIEAGLPKVEVYVWLGLFASAQTPVPILEELNRVLQQTLASPEVKARFAQQGGTAVGGTRGQFEKFVDAEIIRWETVIKASKISAE